MTKFTRSEIVADYNIVNDCPTKATKVALAEKYGVSSAKVADIQKAIVLAMREVRKDSVEFSHEDVVWFGRLDAPERKIAEYYAQESVAFLDYLLASYFDNVRSRKLENKLFMANSRDCYGCSCADKYLMRKYISLRDFIEGSKQENIDKRTKEIAEKEAIKSVLLEGMKEFHDEFISRTKDSSAKFYNELPSIISSLEQRYNKAINAYNDAKRECGEIYLTGSKEEYLVARSKYNDLYKEYQEYYASYRKMLNIQMRFKTQEEYVEYCVEEAENTYNHNVNSIVARIHKHNLNTSAVKVVDVQNDAKFYALVVTDGDKKLYCRSIWAAEFSDKVTPHFRFIITNKK